MKKLSECTILIVDDTKFNIKILVETLSDDYELSVAMDGKSALEFMEKVVPDILLLDIMMPIIKESAVRYAMPKLFEACEFKIAELGDNSGLYGGLTLAENGDK